MLNDDADDDDDGGASDDDGAEAVCGARCAVRRSKTGCRILHVSLSNARARTHARTRVNLDQHTRRKHVSST